MRKALFAILLVAAIDGAAFGQSDAVQKALADPAAAHLAKPTPGQIEWADMECEMFLCLDPCTWQGREYDNHTTPLNKMTLPKLDANQWCEAAKAFGAKQVVLVCKHTGGFCWWPTETTDYCVKNISWKDGKGNMVKETADALRKNGLKMGVYLYSDDPRYTQGIGRGGRTDDPKKQQEWNAKLRKQWEEVLTICGPDLVHEVWFDGGCIVPLKDLINRLAPKAQFFAGPHETVRWPGTESGKLPYPCWSSIPTGLESAGGGDALATGDPEGAKWCPPECDTVLYGRGIHKWFWSPSAEAHRHTVDELMDIYLKSVGRGGVLLLNATPNTDGLIPEGDLKIYREFGAEIKRRFGSPLAQTQGVGDTLELNLGGLHEVNQSWVMEDLRGGHRIRAYTLEGRNGAGQWIRLADGISVGHKKIDVFPTAVVDRLRLRITKRVGTPILRELAAFYADGVEAESVPLTRGRPTTASSTHSAPYSPGFATDGNPGTRWGATDGDVNAWLEVDLGSPTAFGQVSIKELANRIREFVIEYRDDASASWKTAFRGGAVGDDFKAEFPRTTGRFIRLRVVKGGKLGPTLWEFALYPGKEPAVPCGRWDKGEEKVMLDLTPHIKIPATYEVTLPPAVKIVSAKLWFNGSELPADDCRVRGNRVLIRQTQQITDKTRTELVIRCEPAAAGEAKIRMISER